MNPRRPASDAPVAGTLTWMAVAALAFVVRVVHVWAIRGTPVFDHLVGDGLAYDAWARELAAGDWIGRGVFYQAPLYPYFLGTVYAALGHDLLALRLVQAALGAGACVLLGLGAQAFFGARVGLVAAVALAVWPSAFFADALVQKSVLDTFLVCALLAILGAATRRPRPAWWLVAGVVLGLLALTRENTLAFVPVVVAFAALREGSGERLRACAAVGLGLVLVLGPVAVRNRVVGGELHVTTAQFGPNFYIGNNPTATGVYRPLRYGRGDPRFERADATELAERALERPLTPGEVSRYWTGRALDFITGEPGAWLRLVGRKAVLLVNRVEVGDAEDQYTYGEWSPLLRILGAVLHFGILVPLAAAGIVIAWWRGGAARVLVALLAVYAAGVVVTFVMARYRHPALPFLVVFAALAAVEARRPWRPLWPALVVAACLAVPANWPLVSEATVRSASLYNIGRVLEAEPGGLDPAIVYYAKALALDPGYALAHNNLGIALQKRGRLAEGVDHLRRAVALQPGQGDFAYNLGGALFEGGNVAGATEAYTRALALDPGNADAHNNLGVLLQHRGDPAGAIEHHRAALALDPRKADALSNLGTAYAVQGRLDLASESFRAALALDPTARSARENLARALAGQGRVDDAARECETLLATARDDPALTRRVTDLLAALGRPPH